MLKSKRGPLWLSWWRICLKWGRPGFSPWVGKIPWRRERLPTPVFWPGEVHGSQKVGHDWATFTSVELMVIANTLFQQHKRKLYTWTSPDGQHWNQIDYILCSQTWRRSIQSAKTRPGADCGSKHELFIAKFRLKFKKVGKTTRPFRYDLNQIHYDYTVEVRNRFKRLDLIDRVPDKLWTEVRDFVQETGIKTIPMEKKCKKAKWLSGGPYK